ncbi:MAG: FK506 binding protein proline rotamase rapamycin-binding protein [Geoglossum umbratile]|nr:MAG: FK506 binding protein proline rotamase rapamycin-binding protein [Geoglossum umbratile]
MNVQRDPNSLRPKSPPSGTHNTIGQSIVHKTGVLAITLEQGDGVTKPQPGDIVEIKYTGWLYDRKQHKNYFMGKQFATGNTVGVIGEFMKGLHAPSSVTGVFARGGLTDLLSTLGLGWEIAIPKMTLGQKSRLLLTSDHAYGEM